MVEGRGYLHFFVVCLALPWSRDVWAATLLTVCIRMPCLLRAVNQRLSLLVTARFPAAATPAWGGDQPCHALPMPFPAPRWNAQLPPAIAAPTALPNYIRAMPNTRGSDAARVYLHLPPPPLPAALPACRTLLSALTCVVLSARLLRV